MKRIYSCLLQQKFFCDNYSLTVIQDDHIEAIRVWRNAQINILRQSSIIEKAQQSLYYEKYVWPDMLESSPKQILMAFLQNEVLIGYGGLVNIDWPNKRSEISFLLAPERNASHEGYAKDFLVYLTLVKNLAFQDLKLHRLYTETFDVRPHHIKLLEDFGFSREGILQDHIEINGLKVNSVIHGMINKYEK